MVNNLTTNGNKGKIAYFSMEIGLDPGMPTYSGGLGILAGDTIRAAADRRINLVGVSLLYRKGYFYQRLDSAGKQIEEPVIWSTDDFLVEMPQRVNVQIEKRTVQIRCWKYEVKGFSGHVIPVYFLDTDLKENAEQDRQLTDSLYGGDKAYRLCQEIILGIGGVRMLDALRYDGIQKYHMNEGHASLLTVELLDRQLTESSAKKITPKILATVRQKCVFTTHTPVEAGHDKFDMKLVKSILGTHPAFNIPKVVCCDESLNMTYLALSLSDYVNGVAKKHGEVSRNMFAPYVIDSITNGVHAATWVSESFAQLYDEHIPGWREDNFSLRYALGLKSEDVWAAHRAEKLRLLEYINRETNCGMDLDHFTLGFARRATSYKRADLLLDDPDRLVEIADKFGALQVIYAGKAHPNDAKGKELIVHIFEICKKLRGKIKLVYLPNYDIELGQLLTAGVDVWLNTPQPPMEASGTSGMKAALNGVPSFSILDGWWIEGCIENVTGWAIGMEPEKEIAESTRESDADDLYDKLETVVMPTYYQNREQFLSIMLHAIALNGSFFNTHRMMDQYIVKAYSS
ncbi:MAG: alpha-glucan family phosphorylase [Sedimentisphaerales bacterium]|nr:alpha-glucan family phosphorylase [Sedimentisphaerales bacterium]